VVALAAKTVQHRHGGHAGVDGVDVEVTSHTPGYISYVTYVSLADEELVKGAPLTTGCKLGYRRVP
ncbi:MAG: hypothetical protein WAO35_26975, partial [Terriglobia bacterium]